MYMVSYSQNTVKLLGFDAGDSMKLPHVSHIFALLLVLVVSSHLFAANLIATYSEELDTTIATSASFGVGEPNYSLAFHVGTLTVQKIGSGSIEAYRGLTLTQSGFLNNPLKLTSNREINGTNTFNAKMVAKITRNSTTTIVPISQVQGETNVISENTNLSNYPFTVDFYVLIAGIANPGLVAGAHFQFANPPGGTLGSFTLNTYYTAWFFFWQYTRSENIDINSSSSSVPYFGTDYSSGTANFININSVGPTVYASLDIEQTQEQASISLFDAAGSKKKKVGVARITLSGFEGQGTYGVTIGFTDGNGSPNSRFRLKHEDLDEYIPFDIKLNNQLVENGSTVVWNNLSYGSGNTKNLNVTGIDFDTAQTSASGSYADIIYVNITPLDTNLVGL